MIANGNSVNIRRASYHHGDLRAALIEAGLRMLAEQKAEDVSLRAVARAVGVSATAVYRHFPDKETLMAGLAQAGLEQLAVAQRKAAQVAGGGAAGFDATGRAYVRFALANPALFRLIFATPGRHDQFGEDARTVPEAMALLRANAAALAPPDAGPAAAQTLALQAWSIAHGLAMLILDGHAPADDAVIDAVLDARALKRRA